MKGDYSCRSDHGEAYSLMEVTDTLEELEDIERVNKIYRLPPTVKPCILEILGSKGALQTEDSWMVPCIIACELKRVGCTPSQAGRKLEIWRHATPSEVRSAVRAAFEKNYEFGCPRLEGLGICLYKSRRDCPWYAQIPRKGQVSYRERDFYRFGWPKGLKFSEQCIYFTIREIEKKRKMPAGTRLFVSEREMAEVTGGDRKTIRFGLQSLERKGLIQFKKGRQHKHYGIAGEVRRIVPIPRPK